MSDTYISDSIKYIGADDTTLDLFESQYIVPNGVSYNSYIIMDEKIAVMDTVDQRKTDEWFDNLNKALDGKTPDYLVVSHLEPDHAANIQNFVEKALIEKFGGTITKIEEAGKKKLAYEIQKMSEAFYYFIDIDTENTDFPSELESQLRIMENVIRFMTVAVEA